MFLTECILAFVTVNAMVIGSFLVNQVMNDFPFGKWGVLIPGFLSLLFI